MIPIQIIRWDIKIFLCKWYIRHKAIAVVQFLLIFIYNRASMQTDCKDRVFTTHSWTLLIDWSKQALKKLNFCNQPNCNGAVHSIPIIVSTYCPYLKIQLLEHFNDQIKDSCHLHFSQRSHWPSLSLSLLSENK